MFKYGNFVQTKKHDQPCIHSYFRGGRPAGRPGYEADHSPLPNPKVKNALRYSCTSLSVFKTPRFIKHEDNFTISE